MKKIKNNSKEREPVISEMDELLATLNKHVEYLKGVNKMLAKIDKDTDKMEKYYFTEWIEDYNHFRAEKIYSVLSQDNVHDTFQEIHKEKLTLLKKIVSKLI